MLARYEDRSRSTVRSELAVFGTINLFCLESVDDVFDDECYHRHHLRHKPKRQGRGTGTRLAQSRRQQIEKTEAAEEFLLGENMPWSE